MAFYNVMKLEYHDFIQYRIYEKPVEYDVKVDLKKEDVSSADSGECIDVEARKERSMYVSLNRTKQSVYSLSYNNKWDWFVTLTFSDEKVDRYDYSEIIKKTRNWFNNVKKLTKDLCVIAQKRRRYLASNNLDRVEREYLNIPRDQIDNFLVQAYLEDRVDYAKTQKIPEAGQHINYVTIKKGERLNIDAQKNKGLSPLNLFPRK